LMGVVAADLALPTQTQLNWMLDEIGAIGHFNMETYEDCGIGASANGIYVPPATTFAPTNVDTDQWLQALTSFGAKHAVLVVSHGCGFNTFLSRTAFPDFGFVYNYTVNASKYPEDVAMQFVNSAKKYGVKPGFYLGAMNNAFLNVQGGVVGTPASLVPGQANITQDQYTQILLAQLRQVWTDYGELAEVWFDGGYPPNTQSQIADLLAELQPNAVAFQGPGVNTIRWVGTESGHAPDPCWSAAASSLDYGQGSPDGVAFTPSESDTCFQTPPLEFSNGKKYAMNIPSSPYAGCWFYNALYVPKSLNELVAIYHDSVGHNSFLLLDWTPTQVGDMRADHMQRYQEFGDYLRACYGQSSGQTKGNGTDLSITFAQPTAVDRVVIQEDQTYGERVLAFTVSVTVAGGGVKQVASAQSIGNKRIALFSQSYQATEIQLHISNSNGQPIIKNFATFNCTAPSDSMPQTDIFESR